MAKNIKSQALSKVLSSMKTPGTEPKVDLTSIAKKMSAKKFGKKK